MIDLILKIRTDATFYIWRKKAADLTPWIRLEKPKLSWRMNKSGRRYRPTDAFPARSGSGFRRRRSVRPDRASRRHCPGLCGSSPDRRPDHQTPRRFDFRFGVGLRHRKLPGSQRRRGPAAGAQRLDLARSRRRPVRQRPGPGPQLPVRQCRARDRHEPNIRCNGRQPTSNPGFGKMRVVAHAGVSRLEAGLLREPAPVHNDPPP